MKLTCIWKDTRHSLYCDLEILLRLSRQLPGYCSEIGHDHQFPYFLTPNRKWAVYLDLRRRKWWEDGEDCIMRSS
jgi:hypothetical protein